MGEDDANTRISKLPQVGKGTESIEHRPPLNGLLYRSVRSFMVQRTQPAVHPSCGRIHIPLADHHL
jgi:hypothetical protein